MKMRKLVLAALPVALAGALATYGSMSYASDHDDGDTDLKSRALNLTDHFTFNEPDAAANTVITTYFNPRSLPGKQYFLSTAARYEQHVSKVASKTATPTASDDFVFRYEAGTPDATGAQTVTLTLLKNGTVAGTLSGSTTNYPDSKAGGTNLKINTGTVAGLDVRWFIGTRADAFHFDVIRFFQVRAWLAQLFFGGAGGNVDASALAQFPPNCRGDGFFAEGSGNVPDNDGINLWNPPSCAPDFTKNLNVLAIVLEVKPAQLGSTVLDTWSTISVAE